MVHNLLLEIQVILKIKVRNSLSIVCEYGTRGQFYKIDNFIKFLVEIIY